MLGELPERVHPNPLLLLAFLPNMRDIMYPIDKNVELEMIYLSKEELELLKQLRI